MDWLQLTERLCRAVDDQQVDTMRTSLMSQRVSAECEELVMFNHYLDEQVKVYEAILCEQESSNI